MKGKILKISVVFINVLLLVLGIIIAALGIWVLAVDYDTLTLSKIQDNGFYSSTLHEPGLLGTAAVICVAVGGVTIVVSALTFHGVRKESKCCLAICAAILATLILMDVVVIILTGLVQRRTEDHMSTALMEGVRFQYDSAITSKFAFSVYFDRAQVQLECCGVNSHEDFKNNATKWTEKTELKIPRTCCIYNSKSSYLDNNKYDIKSKTCPTGPDTYHDQPCYSLIKDWVLEKTFVLLAVSVFIAGMKLVGTILDILLLRHFKEDAPYNDM